MSVDISDPRDVNSWWMIDLFTFTTLELLICSPVICHDSLPPSPMPSLSPTYTGTKSCLPKQYQVFFIIKKCEFLFISIILF